MKVRQQGMALIVAIVMLLLISVISISSMRLITFHEKMATGLQESIRLGQAAENKVHDMLKLGARMPASIGVEKNSLTKITTRATSVAVRRSIAVGYDPARWRFQHFDITAEAWIDDGNGNVEKLEPGVTHRQGLAILSPVVE